jgi:iron complex outermembrane receptor protein
MAGCALGALSYGENALATPTDASATVAGGSDAEGLGEIIVTAQRREENLQNVPISITALTAAQLSEQHIVDVSDLTRLTPNLSINQGYKASNLRIGIRGIVNLKDLITNDVAVGVYVDGVYYASTVGADQAFVDMERVEVLEGPQGTLFGRNTVGGALNITTRKPTDQLEGSVEGGFGNYGSFVGTGVVNIPLSQDWSTRLVYQRDDHGGFGRNFYLDEPLGDQRQDYVRGSLRGRLAAGWELLATGFYVNNTGNSGPSKVIFVNPTSLANRAIPAANGHAGDLLSNYVGGGFYDSQGGINPPAFFESYGATGTITGQLDAVTLKAISGYTHLRGSSGSDSDGTPYPAVDVYGLPIERETFSQELQAYGTVLDNRLDWITGLYYFTDKGSQYALSAAFAPLAGAATVTGAATDNTSDAAFGQLTYKVLPNLRITGGVRYTQDKRAAAYQDHSAAYGTFAFLKCTLANAPGVTDPALCFYSGHAKYNYVPWTAGIDFSPTAQSLVYAKVSRGYRAGAYNFSGPAAGATPQANAAALEAFEPVAPERVLSPEIGMKVDLLDHRLRVNGAAYYSKYDNIQQTVVVLVNSTPETVLRNAGAGRIEGGELQVTSLLGLLEINASLGITSPKFTVGPSVGQPFQLVSKTTWSLGALYPVDLPFGTLGLNASYNWQSKKYFANVVPGDAQQNADVAQNGYGLLAAKATLSAFQDRWLFSLWGDNITGVKYKVQANTYPAPLGFDQYFAGTPARYGISAAYNFR